VHNDFAGTPRVENNGPGRYTMQDIGELASLLYRQLDALALAQSRQRLADREPPARYGIFADAHVDDRFRDAGAVQTLASSGGVLALALTTTVHNLALQTVATLPYELEPIVEQPLKNDCVKINRFANFEPDPAEIEVTPASDFWVDVREEWASQRTRTIRGGGPRTVSSVEQLGAREEPASFIRAQTLAIELTRMAAGERLQKLEFDGVDMTPAGAHVADEDGALQIALQIPALTFPVGEKLVRVTGMAGSWAEASFTARGRTLVQMRRRVVTRFEQLPRRVRRRRNDPRGQIVILPDQGRHLGAFWAEFCAIGDKTKPVVCELRAVGGDGDVLDEVLAQTQVDMSTVSTGNWTQFVFADLPYLPRDRRYALCLLTGDNEHAISRAIVGNAVDFNDQIRVTKNAYALGNEVESSTGSSWNHLHDSDLKFALHAPRFTQLETRLSLGVVELTACSDLLIRAAVELPEAGCAVHFEVERASGELLVLEADTPLQLDAFLDEHVEVFAVLKGTATASPVLMPGVQLVASQLASSGQYVSRAFKVGGADSLPVRVDARLPAGATATISVRDKSGGWVELAQGSAEPLDLPGWQDVRFSADLSGQLGQMSAVKIELTGTPAARPYIAATRAAAI
ncbi:DUF4815 domain-containing protein, partial [Polycladidibacter hongkongensis]|uniref:DUF4815 domain-containing protein n=1 Tax=Polycladidibacter hongkongensis TaxID=1647556 RepID=UPI0012E399E7